MAAPREVDSLDETGLDRLVVSGEVLPPTVFGLIPLPPASTPEVEVSEVIAAMRDEENW
ncbi:hypothetical protein ACOBQX_20500 [Actinokineospora sp. G85]|uniref:hypothetical protein n=1 Tax=Actinokineospora sp. G85 TaxID=3406626 RepID=UPI003C73A78E